MIIKRAIDFKHFAACATQTSVQFFAHAQMIHIDRARFEILFAAFTASQCVAHTVYAAQVESETRLVLVDFEAVRAHQALEHIKEGRVGRLLVHWLFSLREI